MGKKNRKAVGYEKIFKKESMKQKSLGVGHSENTEKIKELIGLVFRYKEEEKYEDALKVVIDLFNLGYVKTEILYQLVDIYYTISDYDRAVVWGKKTLAFDDNHIPTMLILGKIYAVKNNINECLEMLEKVLSVADGILEDEQKEVVEELLEYLDSDYDLEILREKYPNIETFLASGDAGRLSENFSKEQASEEDLLEMKTEDTAQIVGKEKEAQYLEVDATPSAKREPDPACLASEQDDDAAIADLIASIMTRRISLREKIDQCNLLAVGYYEQDKHRCAMRLLKQALEIDSRDECTLKNWAFILLQCGEKNMALQCLTELRSNDLMVANLIKTLK